MSTWLVILAVLAGIIGIIGSVVPGLPGPPVSWLGLWLLYLGGAERSGGEPMTLTFLLVWLGITVAVTVLDYIVPAFFTKMTGGSRYASGGAMIGMLAGIFLTPVGMLLGALVGAFAAELLFAEKDAGDSLVAALGSFLGFLFGTGLKLVAAGIMMYYIVIYL